MVITYYLWQKCKLIIHVCGLHAKKKKLPLEFLWSTELIPNPNLIVYEKKLIQTMLKKMYFT